MNRYEKATEPLAKYAMLSSLADRNDSLFYDLVRENVVTMAPILYTPTVGLACQNYARLYQRTKGMYFTSHDIGHF
jgi:malate dehydrogenase (oxaloacetate-decarboxylating)(NADP+)